MKPAVYHCTKQDKGANGMFKIVVSWTLVLMLAGGWCILPPGQGIRTVQAQAAAGVVCGKEYVNIKSFGAIGDGRHNDTAAFAAALASLNSKRLLYIPAGTYNITSVTLPAGVRIVGDQGKTVLHGLPAKEAMLVTAADHITLRQLILDGGNNNKQAIHLQAQAANIWLDSCEIRNTYGDATAGSWAVYVQKGCRNIAISKCWFHDIDGPEDGADGNKIGVNRAILAYDVDSMTIANCTFEGIRGYCDGDCVHITGAAVGVGSDAHIVIQDCTFNNFYKRAIKLQVSGVKVLHNTLIADPSADEATDFQAAISVFGNDNVVDGNTIVLYHSRLGVDVNGLNSQIVNNRISVDPSGSTERTVGIYVSAAGSYSTVKGNVICHIPDSIEVNHSAIGVVVQDNQLHKK